MSTSNIFSNVFIYGNCTVQGTFTSLGGSTVSQWTTSGSVIYYSSGNVGIGTAAPVSTFEVTGTGFPGTALTRTAAGDNYGVGIQYSLISNTGSFRGYYARAFGGSLGTIATTNQNQANGYFGIDVANAGLFASDTYGYAGVQFYVAPTISVFNTRVGIGTTNPGSLLTVSGGGSFGSGYNAFTAPTNGMIVQGGVGIGTSNPGVNALQVTGNVVTSGFTSNATNTVFNYDTLTVPFLNATQVGIGITNPGAPLGVYATTGLSSSIGYFADSVYGSFNFSLNTGAGSYNGLTAAGDALLWVTKGTINTGCITIAPHNSGTIGIRIASTANTFSAGANTHSFVSNSSGTAMMTILGNGNVGIGTTSPGSLLTVQQLGSGSLMNVATSTGSSALFVNASGQVGVGTNSQFGNGFGSGLMVNSGTINGSNAFNMVLLSNATTVNYTQVGQIGFGIGGDMPSFSIQSQTVNRDNGAGPYYDYGAQSDLRFLYKTYNTWPAGGVNEAMRIKGTNGNVGIGSTTPAYQLDVVNDINCTGSFRVNTILQPKIYNYTTFTGVTSFDAGNFDLVNFNTVEIRAEIYSSATGGAVQIQALDTAGTVYTAGEQGYVVWQGNRSTAYNYGGTATIVPNTETTYVGPAMALIKICGVSMTGQSGSQRYRVWWCVSSCWAGVGECTDTGQAWFYSGVTINRIRFNAVTTGNMSGKYSIVHYV